MAYSNRRQHGSWTLYPLYPQYADVSCRRESYRNSRKLKHHSQKLAKAGFFYNGEHIQCYKCGQPLRIWHNNVLWYPVCQHIIDEEGHDRVQHSANTSIETPSDHSTSDEPSPALGNGRQPYNDYIPNAACISLAVSGKPEEPTRTGTDVSVSLTTHTLLCCERSAANVQAYYSGKSSIVTSINSPGKEHYSLRLENIYLKERRQCKICKTEEVGITFLPCGHLCCCAKCAPRVGRCPLCQEPVTDRTKAILP